MKSTKEFLLGEIFGGAERFSLSKLGDILEKVALDVGCGDGQMSAALKSRGTTVIRLDIDRAALAKAVQSHKTQCAPGNCWFLCGRSESIPIHSDSIDIIFSRSTLQYMERDAKDHNRYNYLA